MADGDVLEPVVHRSVRRWLLTDSAVATGNGVWVDTGPYRNAGVLHVSGITTGTVQFYGNNAATIPANSVNAVQIGNDYTADDIRDTGPLPRWVKARVSAWTTGTFIVILNASRT